MSNRLCREEIAQNVFFSSVTDSRYKTNRISVNFMTPLAKQTVTENALLSAMIRKSNTEYKNFTEISKRLCDLYGAYLDSGVMKIGETQGVNLYVSAIDGRYALNGEDITTMTAELLCSLIFNSKALNGGYDESELALEKQVLINLIESEINEKRSYAIRKCTKIMCENEAFSIPRYGYSEDVNGITNENLKNACERLIKTARVEIFFTGCGDPKNAREIFTKAFAGVSRNSTDFISSEIRPEVDKVKTVCEKMDIAQGKLVMGFRAGDGVKNKSQALTLFLANVLFGGTPSSRLFLNVREKLSLCYYCAARYDKYKGIIIVDSGIEAKNYQKAKDEILRQLEDIKNGGLTDEELANAVRYIKNSYNSIFDSTKAAESFYLGQIFSETDNDPEEVLEQIDKITLDDIKNAMQTVKLDTVYLLAGEEVEL